MSPLPNETIIKIDQEGSFQKIIIPHQSCGFSRILFLLSLLFWLGGCLTIWFSKITLVFNTANPWNLTTIFWVVGWVVVGGGGLLFLFRLIRPPVPEVIILGVPHLYYDSGIPTFYFNFDSNSDNGFFDQLFFKRKRTVFNLDELETLNLNGGKTGKRLIIEKGKKKFEIAASASEVEKEWLFNTLKAKYS